jgi:hypothetical protein
MLAVWKKVVSKLKKMTRAGVVVTNPDTGASTHNSSHRFSNGAEVLAARGVPMLPVAGGNRISFS